MPDNELNVKIVVDASQLQSGMANAATAVQSASERMAESLKGAGMSAVEAASALKNLGFSTQESAAALQKVGLVAAETAAEVETTTVALGGMDRAMAMATGRVAGMAAGMGMAGGALGRIGAYSSTLGPLLAAAFPIVLIGVAVDLIAKGATALSMMGDEVRKDQVAWGDFSIAIGEEADRMEVANLKIQDQIDKLEGHPNPNRLKEGLLEARLEGEKLAKTLQDDAEKSIELMENKGVGIVDALFGSTASTVDIKNALVAPYRALEVAENQVQLAIRSGDEQQISSAKEVAEAKRAAVQVAIEGLQKQEQESEAYLKTQMVQGQLTKGDQEGFDIRKNILQQLLLSVEAMKQISTEGDKQAKLVPQLAAAKDAKAASDAALKQLEAFNREQEREGKEAEEAAVKRGNAEREAGEQKQQLDSEIAASTSAMLKKDVEEFQRSLAQKTALVEEQGKAQLAQIRANAELQEKTTAQKSVLGGASPAIAQEALAAYQQETGVVNQMIAAEQQLQQTLKATGAAQDDPKVQESMRREMSLMEERNKLLDEYKSKLTKLQEAELQFVRGQASSLFASINSNLVQMVNGQESIVQGIQKIWTGFIDGLVGDFAKMGEQWLMQHVIMAAASKLFHVQDAAAAVASAAPAIAAAKAIGLAQVGVAGAAGVASMAAAPFPIDLTAPEFGASMAAAAAGMLAFESGGMVPGYGPVPAIVHGGEMILNQDQQKAMGSGGHTFNYHQHIAGNATSDTLSDGQAHFEKSLKRTLRRMNR